MLVWATDRRALQQMDQWVRYRVRTNGRSFSLFTSSTPSNDARSSRGFRVTRLGVPRECGFFLVDDEPVACLALNMVGDQCTVLDDVHVLVWVVKLSLHLVCTGEQHAHSASFAVSAGLTVALDDC